MNVSTQFENIGDLWLYRELLRLISARSDLVLNLSRCPPEFIANLDLQLIAPSATITAGTCDFLLTLLNHRFSRRRVFYFLSPGGYHGDISVSKSITAWLRTLLLAILTLIGVKVCLTGVSYERIGMKNARVLAARSRLLAVHLARDSASAKYARELNMIVHGVMPDLSFGAGTSMQDSARPNQPDDRNVALAFRTDQHEEQLASVTRFLTTLATLCGQDVQWKVIVQVERDATNAAAILRSIHEVSGSATIEVVHDDFYRARDAYAETGIVMGNRLHSLLLGAAMGNKPIAVLDDEFNEKIIRTFEEHDLIRQVHYLTDERSAERIAASIMKETANLQRIDMRKPSKRLEEIFDGIFKNTASSDNADRL